MIFAFNEDVWHKAITEFLRVLKPGGHIQLVEVYPNLIDPKYFMHDLLDVFKAVAEKRGHLLDIAERLEGFLRDAGFVDIYSVDGKGPIGKLGGEAGERGKRCMEPVLRAMMETMVSEGRLGFCASQAEADVILEKELKRWDESPELYFQIRVTCASKPKSL